MAKGCVKIDFRIKYTWLIMLINYPLVKMGFDVWIPKLCIEFGKPYFVESK